MKKILEKLISIEKETAKERGAYNLFALFLPDDSPNRWDIVVSADWVGESRVEPLKYLSGKIKSRFTPEELVMISRIVFIRSDNPGLPEALSVKVDNEFTEIRNWEFFGLDIRHAYFITTGRKAAA